MRCITTRGVWLLVALSVGWTAQGAAQTVRSIRLTADNDVFNFWLPIERRPDVAYTHGTRVGLELGLRPWWGALIGGADPVCSEATGTAGCVLTEVEIGQELYTPFDDERHPVPGDRPYAGWLYLGMIGRSVRASGTRAVGLRLGVTGPPSLAEEAQKLIHRWFDLRRPLGWNYQIPFEPGAVLLYEEVRTWPFAAPGRPWSLSVEPGWGAALGNVRTGAHAGLALRIAWNAPRPNGWRSTGSSDLRAYVEGRVRGSLVLHDLFLDGSTWAESVRVDKELFVPRTELRLGIGLPDVGLEYRVVHSGKQFGSQPVTHTYSSIVLVVRP